MPAFTPFTAGGGPVIPGKLYPFVFITIACGAISGFHALISSGTTPKMIAKETDARMIGYGSMLMEGVVGVVALIAATSLFPGDYFAINTAQKTDAQKAAYVRMVDEHSAAGLQSAADRKSIDWNRSQARKTCADEPGGAVTLALGIAKIFDGIPGLRGLMKYWYHFAIMFEALFILTTIDTGTRVARFLVGEFGGRFYRKLEEPNWLPGSIITSALVVTALGGVYLVGIDLNNLAHVWHRESTAGGGRALRRHHHHHQLRQSEIRLGDNPAAELCRDYNSGGWLGVDHRHLLAAGAKTGDGDAGLHQHLAHRHDHDRRRGHLDRLDSPLARLRQTSAKPRRPRRSRRQLHKRCRPPGIRNFR